jgi:hypothetical protein
MTQSELPQQTAIETLLLILRKTTPATVLRQAVCKLTPDEWRGLLEVANHQGLLPYLYGRLQQSSCQECVPDTIQEKLNDVHLSATVRNMRMLHHGGLILKAFADNQIQVIVLKGSYLSEAVYENIGLRVFVDLDLLVNRNDITRAIKVMQGLGYELTTWFDPAQQNRDLKHVPPMKKEHGPFVEIHWSILDEEEPFSIDTEGLWQRAIPAMIADVNTLALSAEDLILHLCTHMTYQHRLQGGLQNLVDIAQSVDKFAGEIDWKMLITTAEQWGIERVIWLTFRLMEAVLEFHLPEIDRMLRPDEVIDPEIITLAKSQLLSFEPEPAVNMTPDLAKLSATHNIFARVNIILKRIFIPKRTLARVYNVPPNSLKIYGCYLRRFTDLFRQYAPSARLLKEQDQAAVAQADNQRIQESLVAWMEKC